MSRHPGKAILLRSILPEFCVELEQLRKEENESGFAAQASGLVVVDLCGRGDGFYASFYTQPKPEGAYQPDARTILLDPAKGTVNVDIVAGRIAYVEVLHRNEIRVVLLDAFPD